MADSEQVDLLLIGKRGVGKSATGNSILGREAFKTDRRFLRVTKPVDLEVSEFKGRVIQVVDTPGIDYGKDITPLMITMEHVIALNPRGYNAFLLVVSYGCMFTPDDQRVIDTLKMTFGQDVIARFCILVVTCDDTFECYPGVTVQEWCNTTCSELQDLTIECNNRVVLFDNTTRDLAKKKKQMENLLNVVDNLSSTGQRYTYDNVARAKKAKDALYNSILQSRK